MKIVQIAVAALLTAVALIGGSATALADPVATAASTEVYSVTAWHDVNIRTCPATACTKAGFLPAGYSTNAYCYMHGEPVTDFGITRDIWVLVGHQDGGNQFLNALYLVGDLKGNMPANSYCKIHG